jgi:hypothetical protein
MLRLRARGSRNEPGSRNVDVIVSVDGDGDGDVAVSESPTQLRELATTR